MVGSRFIPGKVNNAGWTTMLEKNLINKFYPFIEVKVMPAVIVCVGTFQPTTLSVRYTYRIEYVPPHPPKVFVVSPQIDYDEDIHMFPQDNSLCLYYHKDESWTPACRLYNTIIPWTHEWFVFYEWYLIAGKWKHPAVKHDARFFQQ